jgi:hypothetical protein
MGRPGTAKVTANLHSLWIGWIFDDEGVTAVILHHQNPLAHDSHDFVEPAGDHAVGDDFTLSIGPQSRLGHGEILSHRLSGESSVERLGLLAQTRCPYRAGELNARPARAASEDRRAKW